MQRFFALFNAVIHRSRHWPARLPAPSALLLLVLVAACSPISAAPTSPASHSTMAPTRQPAASPSAPATERLDAQTIASASGRNGLVVGTMAPAAVEAGQQILQQGGNAVDAALTTALAQVPLLPGNFISYAGIMELLYYDAASQTVYSLNAGWNVPQAESDALSIPATQFPFTGSSQPSGRTALIPGFMAGLESAHRRFGSLSFSELFGPAITFAREGVVLDELQAEFLAEFDPVITRLPETAALFTGEDGKRYQAGDLFQQPLMADTLEQVARKGADYMYNGAWGRAFVDSVQREGGLITIEDLATYEPLWTEPVSTTYRGYRIYGPGRPGVGGLNLVEGINLIEAAGLDRYGHFSQDPESLFWMMQIARSSVLSSLDPLQRKALFPALDLSPESRLSKETAGQLWQGIEAGTFPFFTPLRGMQDTHSAAVVAADSQGNIAALTHTSNSYLYGGTGLAVGGIYIPDPGSYQQRQIALAGPGERLPNPINPVIVLQEGQPVWASSCIGSVHHETVQRLASVLTYGFDLLAAQQAPTILAPRFGEGPALPVAQFFPGDFDQDVLKEVEALGQPLEEIQIDFDNYALNRGILAAVSIDRETGSLSGAVPAALGGFATGY